MECESSGRVIASILYSYEGRTKGLMRSFQIFRGLIWIFTHRLPVFSLTECTLVSRLWLMGSLPCCFPRLPGLGCYRELEQAKLLKSLFWCPPSDYRKRKRLYLTSLARYLCEAKPLRVHIAQFRNCYGPEGTWRGGREKAPAAIRAYTYVGDMIEGIYMLMHPNLEGPVNRRS